MFDSEQPKCGAFGHAGSLMESMAHDALMAHCRRLIEDSRRAMAATKAAIRVSQELVVKGREAIWLGRARVDLCASSAALHGSKHAGVAAPAVSL
jgi:hypothetical protein